MKKKALRALEILFLASALGLCGCGASGIDSERRDGVVATNGGGVSSKVFISAPEPAPGEEALSGGSSAAAGSSENQPENAGTGTEASSDAGNVSADGAPETQPENAGTGTGDGTEASSDAGSVPEAGAPENQPENAGSPDSGSQAESASAGTPSEGEQESEPASGGASSAVIGTEGMSFEALMQIDNTRLVAGYAPNERDELNRPMKAVNYQGAFSQYNAEFLRGDAQTVMLTFTVADDNTTMNPILDILAARGIRARFFVTGNYAKLYPDIIRRIISEGHILGSHSMNHPSEGMQSLSLEELVDDTMAMQNFIRETYGYEMTEYAFPSGTFSERALAAICQLGYHTVFYSFAYNDYEQSAEPDPAASLERLLGELHPGSIYLLHGSSSTSAAILGDFIDGAAERGYSFIS